jgi:small subunit ribosomal protein S17
MAEQQRPRARTREGVVVSSGMDKTIVVAVRRRVRFPRYRKYITVSKKFMAHDERNECGVGERVVISESRPLSKNKRWRLRAVLEKAKKDVAIVDPLAAEVEAEAEVEGSAS